MQDHTCALQHGANIKSLDGFASIQHWCTNSDFQQKRTARGSRERNHFWALLRCSVTPVFVSVTGSVIRHRESGQMNSSGGAGSPASIVVSSSKLTLRRTAAGLGLVLGCATNAFAVSLRRLQVRAED